MRAILSSSHFTDEEVEAQGDEAIHRKWKSHSGSRAHELYSILRISSYRYLEVVEILSLKIVNIMLPKYIGEQEILSVLQLLPFRAILQRELYTTVQFYANTVQHEIQKQNEYQ